MRRPRPYLTRGHRSPMPPSKWTRPRRVPETPITAPAVEALAVDECALEYEVAVGDFWIRIADGSGAVLADVLAVNDATVSTPLYPGRSICLPDGAMIPPPPPVPTTAAPTSTVEHQHEDLEHELDQLDGSTTPATTTSPPTPAPPPPASTAGPAEVEAIIRSVWPDELEDRALEIARRESNLRSDSQELVLLRLVPGVLERSPELAERPRHHVGRPALRSGHQRACGARPLRACGRLGPLGRLTARSRRRPIRSLHCSDFGLHCRPSQFGARSSMDRALDYGSSGWEFDSLRARRTTRAAPPGAALVASRLTPSDHHSSGFPQVCQSPCR